jgi:hypothetical protein
VRQHGRLAAEAEPCRLELLHDRVACHAHLRWRPGAQIVLLPVDHDEAARGLQCGAQRLQVLRVVGDVMPRVADEDEINRAGGQLRVVGRREDGLHVGEARRSRLPVEMADHVGADIDRVHPARRTDVPGEAQREVARPGADVGHDLAARQVERGEHLARPLPLVALGVVQRGDVGLRVRVHAPDVLDGGRGARRGRLAALARRGGPGRHGKCGPRQRQRGQCHLN